MKASLDAGRVVRLSAVTTRVATMACAETDSCVFELVRDHVDEIVLVSDDDMLDACRWLWFELGIASDLSGAAAIAAVRTRKLTFAAGRSVAAVVCGAVPDGMD